ncbi:MAG TPA: type II toxin-antitoxin system VapC family toxin [Candidatus Nanoarchaeia archaeon]|nr:type II toxin-antitoxin system VapC family toxin [Candidatus Nanoarchaeia archaeon]
MAIYIDANVFIFAAVSDDVRGNRAREIIDQVISGEEEGVTSSLTIDEVTWKVFRETKDRELAINEGLEILEFSNLKVVAVDAQTIKRALHLMKKHNKIAPRDAIHLEVALRSGCGEIVSDDADFDKINEIKRRSLE